MIKLRQLRILLLREAYTMAYSFAYCAPTRLDAPVAGNWYTESGGGQLVVEHLRRVEAISRGLA